MFFKKNYDLVLFKYINKCFFYVLLLLFIEKKSLRSYFCKCNNK